MKKQTLCSGVLLLTRQILESICINRSGFIGDYGPSHLKIGDTVIIASLIERGKAIKGTVTDKILVNSNSRIKKYHIYFNQAEISFLLPANVKFGQNFTYLTGEEVFALAA